MNVPVNYDYQVTNPILSYEVSEFFTSLHSWESYMLCKLTLEALPCHKKEEKAVLTLQKKDGGSVMGMAGSK